MSDIPEDESPQAMFERLMVGSVQTHAPFKLPPELEKALLAKDSEFHDLIKIMNEGKFTGDLADKMDKILAEQHDFDKRVFAVAKVFDELLEQADAIEGVLGDKALQEVIRKASGKTIRPDALKADEADKVMGDKTLQAVIRKASGKDGDNRLP